MRRSLVLGLLLVGAGMFGGLNGCARPNEIGWTPVYTTGERGQQIARNWDMEGKMTQDDIDDILMLRPMSGLSYWHISP